MLREIKIFSLLEHYKTKRKNGLGSLLEIVETSKINDGLPELLGYKIGQGVGEILMTNGGECLEYWMERVKSHRAKVNFAVEMLRQIIPALERLHSNGYSHGDLKLENICARASQSDSCVKFTLIDFGMS